MLQSVSRMASFIKIRWASESIVKENSTKNLFLAINKPSRRSTYISLKSPEYSSNSRTRFDADGHKFLAQAKSRLLDFWLVFCFGPGKVFGDGIIKKERDTQVVWNCHIISETVLDVRYGLHPTDLAIIFPPLSGSKRRGFDKTREIRIDVRDDQRSRERKI
jgi:hypothetical protein